MNRSEKTMEDLSHFVATLSTVSNFVATLSNVGGFARRFLKNLNRIFFHSPTTVMNPVQAERKQKTDELQSRQSEQTSFSLATSPTSAIPSNLAVVATSFSVATVAAVIGRTAAVWNLPGSIDSNLTSKKRDKHPCLAARSPHLD